MMKLSRLSSILSYLQRLMKTSRLLVVMGAMHLGLFIVALLTSRPTLIGYSFEAGLLLFTILWMLSYIQGPLGSIKAAIYAIGLSTFGGTFVVLRGFEQVFNRSSTTAIFIVLILIAGSLVAVAFSVKQKVRRDAAFRWSLVGACLVSAISNLLAAFLAVPQARWQAVFIGLHALQVIPSVGLLLTIRQIKRVFIDRGRILFVAASVVGYLGVILSANGLHALAVISGLSLVILVVGVISGRRVLNGAIWNLDIDSVHVETNPEYLPRNNTTYCNIYVADLVNMRSGYGSTYGGGLRNHLRDKYPLPVQLSNDVWLDANRMIQWLRGQLTGSGPNAQDRGWIKVTLREAVEYANQGYPTLAVWESSNDSDPGHLAAVRAGNLTDVPLRELQIAQSGKSNFSCGALRAGFGDREPIGFFVMLVQ